MGLFRLYGTSHYLIFFVATASLAQETLEQVLETKSPSALSTEINQLKIDSLLEAYPGQIKSIDPDTGTIYWKNGRSDLFNPIKSPRSVDEMLEDPDIEDQFHFVYPLFCDAKWKPPVAFDPGRIRSETMMNAIYGETQREVEDRLGAAAWLGGESLRTTRVNQIDKKFSELAKEFSTPPLVNYKKYLYPSAGAYNRRYVAGTRRLSSHSWGHGIDINLAFSNYWKWELKDDNTFKYKNRIPCEVVKAFEAKGFIWGGKWDHYDTMHFEYRPELIKFAKKLEQKYGAKASEVARKAGLVVADP